MSTQETASPVWGGRFILIFAKYIIFSYLKYIEIIQKIYHSAFIISLVSGDRYESQYAERAFHCRPDR